MLWTTSYLAFVQTKILMYVFVCLSYISIKGLKRIMVHISKGIPSLTSQTQLDSLRRGLSLLAYVALPRYRGQFLVGFVSFQKKLFGVGRALPSQRVLRSAIRFSL